MSRDGHTGEQVVSLAQHSVDRATIELLKRLIVRVENAEVIGVAVVGITADNKIYTEYSCSMQQNVFTAVGGCRYLEKRLLDNLE